MAARTDEAGAAYAGSQLQTQLYVNKRVEELDDAIKDEFPALASAAIDWRSPLACDEFREYWDAGFLGCVELGHHTQGLKAFWPSGGPHWDALATLRFAEGEQPGVLLVEGKSYPGELFSGGCAARPGSSSRALIEKSIVWTQRQLGVEGRSAGDWCGRLYQNANRLAHLCWLQSLGVRAWLVHLLFTSDPHGATTAAEWDFALAQADRELGIADLEIPHAGHTFLEARPRAELLDN